jgi:ELWxxDGT repeat protein
MLLLGGCGKSAGGTTTEASAEDHRKISLVIADTPKGGESLGLTGSEPIFIGLGIREDGKSLLTQQLQPGENEIAVPIGKELEFRASVYSRPASGGGLVYSVASARATIFADPKQLAELTLQFEPYRQARLVNVYGLVHETATRPKSGAQVSVKDPISGAVIRLEGLNSFSTTDAFGSYAFAFPVGLPFSSDVINVVLDGQEATERTLALSDKGLPGYTLEAINLSNDGVVVPAFANQNDFDNDGTLNLVEITSGTNPFSELSGAKGDKGERGDKGDTGEKGDSGVSTGIFVTTLPSGNVCAAGGQSFQAFRDDNANGIRESAEVTLGSPTISCFPVPVVVGPNDETLANSAGLEVGVRLGDSQQPLLETIFGHIVRLVQSSVNFFLPERINLHYALRDCAGQAHSPYLAVGQAAYPHLSQKPVTTTDGRVVMLQSRSLRTTSGCQNIESMEQLPVEGPEFHNSSYPTSFFSVGPSILTVASGGIFMSDGTPAGTSKVSPGSYFSRSLRVGSKVFYDGDTPASGRELWITDGSAAGTTFVDVNPGTGGIYIQNMVELSGKAIFSANDGQRHKLWSSDGTGVGTVLLKDFTSGGNYLSIDGMWKAGGIVFLSIYFNDGTNYQSQLWKTDGTTAGTVLVKDIAAGSVDTMYQNNAAVLGATLLFTVDSGSGDKQLWISDGSTAGTVLLKQINTTASADPGYFVSHGAFVYFVADDGTNGRELWRTDGTAGGTIMLTPGNSNFDCYGGCSYLGQGSVLYAQSSSYVSPNYQNILIRTDGSAAGTITFLAATSSQSDIVDFSRSAVSNSGVVFLPANNGTMGWEPATLTPSGLTIIKDINTGTGSSVGHRWDSRAGSFAKSPSGAIYFAASENGGPRDLWRTDGTSGGTVRVLSRSLNDGLEIDRIAAVGEKLFFGARPIGGGSTRYLQVFSEGLPNIYANESYTRVLELDGPEIAPGTGLSVVP